jgi:hypothetical protein
MNHPQAVADAATKLAQAIQAARAAGYRVTFPDHALVAVPVSETGRVTQMELVTDAPLAGTGEAIQLPPHDLPPVAVIGKASKGT